MIIEGIIQNSSSNDRVNMEVVPGGDHTTPSQGYKKESYKEQIKKLKQENKRLKKENEKLKDDLDYSWTM